MKVHCDQVCHARFGQHLRHQLRYNAAALLHLRLLGIRQVRYDADYIPGTGGLAGVAHYQKLHYVVIGLSVHKRENKECFLLSKCCE